MHIPSSIAQYDFDNWTRHVTNTEMVVSKIRQLGIMLNQPEEHREMYRAQSKRLGIDRGVTLCTVDRYGCWDIRASSHEGPKWNGRAYLAIELNASVKVLAHNPIKIELSEWDDYLHIMPVDENLCY